MTFTWSGTISTDLSKVRHIIRDTDSTDPLLTDEEINFELSECSDVYGAAKRCVRRILAKFARETDRSGARFSATRSQKFQQYKDLLDELAEETMLSAEPYWSENSVDDADDIESDSDERQAAFLPGREDYPGTGGAGA
jgi:hypothetical protein